MSSIAWTWTNRETYPNGETKSFVEFPISEDEALILMENGCSVVTKVWPHYTQCAVQIHTSDKTSDELDRLTHDGVPWFERI